MSRRRLRKAKYRTAQTAKVHDLTAQTILPHNAKVFVDEIDDAWALQDYAKYDPNRRELVAAPRQRANAIRSTRSDPLAALKAQGAITDDQFEAGQIWGWSYTKSEIGPLKAIDPTLERVDGGQLADPINKQVKQAVANLRKAKAALGPVGEALVTDVIGKGLTLTKAADARGLMSKSGREYIGRRFRECLDCLAEVFGCATPKQQRVRI